MFKAYYAHPITTANKKSKRIDEICIRELKYANVKIINPEDYGLKDNTDFKEIVRRNKDDVTSSDLFIANLTVLSYGTISECCFADTIEKDRVAIVKDITKLSAWIRHCFRYPFGVIIQIPKDIDFLQQHLTSRKYKVK